MLSLASRWSTLYRLVFQNTCLWKQAIQFRPSQSGVSFPDQSLDIRMAVLWTVIKTSDMNMSGGAIQLQLEKCWISGFTWERGNCCESQTNSHRAKSPWHKKQKHHNPDPRRTSEEAWRTGQREWNKQISCHHSDSAKLHPRRRTGVLRPGIWLRAIH